MSKLVYKEEVEKLQKFKRDLRWFRANYEEIKKEYKGRHVAIKDEEIIESDPDYQRLLYKLRNELHRNPSSYVIEYVNDLKFGYVL